MAQGATSSSFVQDAASVAASRFHEAVSHIQKPETRSQIQAKVDYVVKKIFAPCVGEIGGVPFDDSGAGEGSLNCPDAVPVEVSPNTSEENMNAPATEGAAAAATQQPDFTFGAVFPESTENGRQENSLKKLRKLGARHQLASGYVGPSLPDAARPVSPEEKYVSAPAADNADTSAQEDIDFDDGISAISSHTLEEMEKRRQLHTVRVSPNQFSKQKLPPSDAEYPKTPMMETKPKTETISGEMADDNVFGEPFFKQTPPKLERVGASNVSNDSQQLEEAWGMDEVNYWNDEVNKDKTHDKRSSRRHHRASVEERAKRLRELDRSRSRSSGTGSNEQHPHETSGLMNMVRVQEV